MKKQKASTLKQTVGLAALAGVGGVVGFSSVSFGLDMIPDRLIDQAEPLILIPGFLITAFLAIFLHETGHLIAGMWAGMTPNILMVGPISIEFDDGKLSTVKLKRGFSGGFVLALPSSDDEASQRREFFWLASGGPAASLLLALLAFPLVSVITSPNTAMLMGFFALTSLGVGIMTLIPSYTGGISSDGMKLWLLKREGSKTNALVLQMKVMGLMMGNSRPLTWPSTLADPIEGLDDNDMSRITPYQIQLLQLLDQDTADKDAIVDALSRYIDCTVAVVPPAFQDSCYTFAAQVAAFGLDDQAAFQNHQKKVSSRGIFVTDFDRALLALAAAETAQDRKQALEHAQKLVSDERFPAVANLLLRSAETWVNQHKATLAA